MDLLEPSSLGRPRSDRARSRIEEVIFWSLHTQRACNALGRCNCGFQGRAALLQRSQTLQVLILGPRSSPATLPDAATAASRATHRSSNAHGRCSCSFQGHAALQQRSQALQLLLAGPRNAPATLPDATTADSGATQLSRNAPGRCNCCFQGHDGLQQCSWTLQLRLPGPRRAPASLPCAATAASEGMQQSCSTLGRCNCCSQGHATLLQRCWMLQLPDAATAASWAAQRSCNAPERCDCCFQGHATLLQRSRTLQLLLPGPRSAPATLPGAATAVSGAT